MDLAKLIQTNRDEILRIADRYGAANVRIFGSVARGEAGTDSDLDLLVDLEPGRSLLDLGGLLMELGDLLMCPVDAIAEKGLRDRIRQRVLKRQCPYCGIILKSNRPNHSWLGRFV